MDFVAGVSMTGVRTAAVLVLMAVCISCGETYRPVATPIPPLPPSPAFSHLVVVISGNGSAHPGASTSIDVSGDTAVSQSAVGLMPVQAALVRNGTIVYVPNSGDDTVSTFSPGSAVPVTTISLPTGSTPTFAASTEAATVYVANSGSNTVFAIDTVETLRWDDFMNGLCKELVVQNSPAPAQFFADPTIRRYGVPWTFPTMSVLGRSKGSRTLLAEPGYTGWQPFDPAHPPDISPFKFGQTICR